MRNVEPARFHDQRFHLAREQVVAVGSGSAGDFSDNGANAGTRFKQAVCKQSCDDLVRGIGVDMGFAAERADRRKSVAGSQLAGNDGARRSENDLLADGNARPEVDAERDHVCTMTASTP